ncbi:HtaA domain-containing protein [Streptomyces sp. XM4193]|uniref:HtaA domain-containing protein n=1 Tax=Streptomyces sp. XM4193 TaxID=2929782 RepID=UPI001FFBDDF3|nr:HtaA domain-containing protein [Streptomyces sp. XM4193]MCK1796167.1 HtaA domain-containing protein [Streptomyces sp. XM4193]
MPTGRTSRLHTTALLAALLGALLFVPPAPTADAADRTVQGGRLDWGIKSSFQNYVTGPIAKGSWSLSGGAGTVGEKLFRFHSASGAYDPDAGSLSSAFGGGVRFTGHTKADGENELDLTVSSPTVRISGRTGTLYADIRSKARGSGQISDRRQVPMASLNLGGVDMRGGGSAVALNGVPATLTAEGAKSFAGYYEAGTPLDPISLSVDVKPAKEASAGDGPGGPGKAEESEKPGKDGTSEKAGTVADAALDWGVRRTFREYVGGPIAEGRWKLSGGARDGGALYRFPGEKGRFDAEKGELSADFGGSVHFTGKDLDLTLEKLSVSVKKNKGTLRADGTAIATFDAPLKPEKGLLLVEEADTELTEDGAKLFGSLYRAGTEMDPLTLAVALDEDAKLPALPDLGSEPTTEPPAKSAQSDGKDATDSTASAATDSGDSGTPVLPLTLAAALLVVAAGATWFVRRRRTAATSVNSEEQAPR